jgi:carbon monoxide dehydrogenase subunit G
MEIDGEQRIAATREVVWAALNDPETLRLCIPGCDSLERISENEFDGTVTPKVGPVKASFGGRVTLSDIDPPNGYTLSGEGKGTAGFAKGEASVRLREDGGETVLSYTAKAQVGGKLAQVGSRLIDGTMRKLSGQFFAKLSEHLAAVEVTPAVAAPEAPATTLGGLSPKAWTVGLIVLAALLLWIFAATGGRP